MRHHCLLIGFHSWPTFCLWGFSSRRASPVMWRREEGQCISEFADLIVAPFLITLLFGSAKVSPTCSLHPVILFPISKRLPTIILHLFCLQTGGTVCLHFCTPLYAYSNGWTLLFAIWESHAKIYLSLSGRYLSLPIFFANCVRTSVSESHLIEFRLFKLLEASTNQQCKHKQMSLLCIRQIIRLS